MVRKVEVTVTVIRAVVCSVCWWKRQDRVSGVPEGCGEMSQECMRVRGLTYCATIMISCHILDENYVTL